ncbi:putative DNA methylase [Pseudomonas phage BHU-1]|uniref:Uncharacterized protein n=1 Tax=Pseudomonas phage PA_L9 TaxID=3232177 RepID=A0AAU8L129_9CAUD|nr:putative DNA methylase [Pseudomonas phage BHU-1]UGV19986.1 putative DNA methylase [Pseudomonas phage Pa BHU-15]UIW13575.1 putative DNA methylase [Pseudomonas phage Pa BHU-17]
MDREPEMQTLARPLSRINFLFFAAGVRMSNARLRREKRLLDSLVERCADLDLYYAGLVSQFPYRSPSNAKSSTTRERN